ncbi:hypothetical protein B0O80DRAFT_485633 [Mortierella sp. GBAus27b]|nr:hypothetical protein B0O80DRAFT_485633 [Mortierella sp. GBAus27b]
MSVEHQSPSPPSTTLITYHSPTPAREILAEVSKEHANPDMEKPSFRTPVQDSKCPRDELGKFFTHTKRWQTDRPTYCEEKITSLPVTSCSYTAIGSRNDRQASPYQQLMTKNLAAQDLYQYPRLLTVFGQSSVSSKAGTRRRKRQRHQTENDPPAVEEGRRVHHLDVLIAR